MTENEVILVNENDQETGQMGKLEAHQKGLLHRAFSVFIFNSKNELLLQKRAEGKYHSGNLWTNSCCSHPIKGEEIEKTIQNRLKEEMGLQCKVNYQFKFIYNAEVGNGLTENEFDHVYFGFSDTLPHPNPDEVSDYKYISKEDLKADLQKHPENYTSWLKICFNEIDKRW